MPVEQVLDPESSDWQGTRGGCVPEGTGQWPTPTNAHFWLVASSHAKVTVSRVKAIDSVEVPPFIS